MQKCMQFNAAALRLAALYAPFAWRAYPFCVAERCMAIGLVNTNAGARHYMRDDTVGLGIWTKLNAT